MSEKKCNFASKICQQTYWSYYINPKFHIMKKIRGNAINSKFANSFLSSRFNELLKLHREELFLGVRNGYLNLYYNCDSIARIGNHRKGFLAEIDKFYLTGKSGDGSILKSDDVIFTNYEAIKKNSQKKLTPEKKAQQQLVIRTNNNEKSDWYCFDVEYKKGYKNIDDRKGNFSGRFDILAISKSSPHRVALIELKYGIGAISGSSGIRKHIKDFNVFNGNDKNNNSYYRQYIDEVISIINAQVLLGINVPQSLRNLCESDFESSPAFYVITLDNNPVNGYTPKNKIDGQLFSDKRWGAKKITSLVYSEGDYYQITDSTKLHTTFLFSTCTLDHFTIDDVLDEKQYEDKEVL